MGDSGDDKNNLDILIERLQKEVTGSGTFEDDEKGALIINSLGYEITLKKLKEDYSFTMNEGNKLKLYFSTKGKFENYKERLSELYSHCLDLIEKHPLMNANKKAGKILEEIDQGN